jgi:hypothetical protein
MGKPEEKRRKLYMVWWESLKKRGEKIVHGLMGKPEEKRRENCTWFDGKA